MNGMHNWLKILFNGTKYTSLMRNSFFRLLLILMLLSVTEGLAQQNPYEFKIGHPRIIMNKYHELALRFTMMEDPLAGKLKSELKKDADALLNSKNIKYSLDKNQSMLSISREYLRRILILSLAYRIFEDDKYSDKAINMMMHVCEYPDWNPQYFLDVAEMTAALAIGYDWNFYHLNLREKETIRNKIVENGLQPGLDVYNRKEGKPHVWHEMNNHWNQVCAGGLILGALAVGEDFPDLKNNIIYQAIKNLVPTIELYEPDGAWFEGPGNAHYANSFLAMAISGMQSALEHDFGLADRPALNKASLFYVNTVSPAGYVFNFADTDTPEPTVPAVLFWFSKRFGQKDVSGYCKEILTKNITPGSLEYGKNRDRFFFLSLPWFDEGQTVVSQPITAQQFTGPVDLLFFRGKDDKNAMYLAAKGGKATLSNQQLDAGSFVIDADGERWGIDLGAEHSFLPGFFDNSSGGKRWDYYRNTNRSHNTLVFGDDIQNANGESKVIKFKDKINQPFGIIDLTAVYPETSKVNRGFKMLSEDQMLIRDEIFFSNQPTSIRWGMMTDAIVELLGDKAILTKNGKKFIVQAFTDEDVSFKIAAANANHKDAKDNTGKSILFIILNQDLSRDHVDVSIVLGRNMDGVNEMIVKSKLSVW
jgi:oligo-alginate lyase